MNGLKWFLLGFLTVVIGSCLVNTAAEAAPDNARTAPVVMASPKAGIMIQTGWYDYTYDPTGIVLYCVEHKNRATLDCVVYVVTDAANGVVMVEGVKKTREDT